MNLNSASKLVVTAGATGVTVATTAPAWVVFGLGAMAVGGTVYIAKKLLD